MKNLSDKETPYVHDIWWLNIWTKRSYALIPKDRIKKELDYEIIVFVTDNWFVSNLLFRYISLKIKL